MASKSQGIGYGAIAAGSLFLYAGIRGYSIPQAAQNIITGKSPATGQTTALLTSSAGGQIGGGSPAGSTTSSAIANAALKYNGHCYRYGGAPGLDGKGCWDCSSFVNWVLGHDLGLAIPGFKTYDGSQHGPGTVSYLVWGGGQHILASHAVAGDLVVSGGVGAGAHMGIITGPGEYISAHDPAEGTSVSPLSTFPDHPIFYIRVKAAGNG
jgi:peptidoglycan DL-endopeptidase CwlO